MLTSYIMDKECFCFLYELLGGSTDNIPKKFTDGVTAGGYDGAVKKLENQGYIHAHGSRVDVERTIRFLIVSVIRAKGYSATEDGRGYIYDCEKLCIIAEEDSRSPRKCRLIPIKDKEMLDEYLSDIKAIQNGEEDM